SCIETASLNSKAVQAHTPKVAQEYDLKNSQARPEQDCPRAGGSDQALDQASGRDQRGVGARGGKSGQLCSRGAQGAWCSPKDSCDSDRNDEVLSRVESFCSLAPVNDGSIGSFDLNRTFLHG